MEGRVSPRAQAAGGFPLELEANSSAGDFSSFVRVQSAKRLFRLFRLPAMVGSSYSGNSWPDTNLSPTRASLDHFTLLERCRGDIALSPSRPSRSRREICIRRSQISEVGLGVVQFPNRLFGPVTDVLWQGRRLVHRTFHNDRTRRADVQITKPDAARAPPQPS